ncbi:cytochrome P450 [Streptomyces virginiae]|uniref:cytochrome P450 n=1 Tax=Streptomyces virginiae TaxID=1961 RepID=UPI0036A4D2C7
MPQETMTHATLGFVPGRRWLVGHALKMRKDAFSVMDSARSCGDIAVVWLGPKPAYVISHPALIRQLLAAEDRSLDKGPLYENLAQLIGVSIGTLTGHPHRVRRRMIAPAYAPNDEIISTVAFEVASSWRPGHLYDMVEEMRRLSFTVMARTLFTDAITADSEAEFVQLLPVALTGIAKYMADPTGVLKRIPTADNRRVNHALTRLQQIIDDGVSTYRSAGAGAGGIVAALTDARDPQTGQPLSAEQIRNEAMVLMSAGSETVAGVLSHACSIMAHDPAIAEQLHAEVDHALVDLPMNPGKIPQLEYAKRVIHEILRLFPSGALMSRRATVEINLGGHRIPPGAALFFCPYLLHRRVDLFDDPDRFDPDRWLPERAQRIPHGAFVPFGAGPHICLGDKIAWSESTTAIATISRLWNLQPAAKRAPRLILAPTLNLDAVPVTVEPRHPAQSPI